jgi:hypothetical protein
VTGASAAMNGGLLKEVLQVPMLCGRDLGPRPQKTTMQIVRRTHLGGVTKDRVS